MQATKAISAQEEVISANIESYREIADKYDHYEICVRDRALQAMLYADLSRIAGLVRGSSGPLKCLDCGGGSGNLSLKMLEMGWDVTVVDVSPEMLGILRKKAEVKGFAPKLIHSAIEDYLSASSEKYDLISFSSVLHHLYSYLTAVGLAAEHIQEGGIFYSSFDPVVSRNKSLRNTFEAFDTTCSKVFHDRADFFPGIGRRLNKLFRGRNETHGRAIASAGDLAEYHAKTGVADAEIVDVLKTKGFQIVEHLRCPMSRTWLTRLVNDRFRLMESAKIIAKREPRQVFGAA
jgi:2-polyprenyl-3-methyl-5-hydroxy-6-metoxy-1,4-benzoquinol methylase